MHLARPATLLAALLLASAPASYAQTADAAGHWEGTVQMNEAVPIAIDLAHGPAGAWIGSITVPGSPAVDIPLDPVVVDAGKIRFRAGLMEHPWFEAALSDDANRLSGEASSPRGSTTFELARKGEAHVTPRTPNSVLPKTLGGTWEGVITMDGASRRIVLIVEAAADGTALASLYSVDKNTQEIPVTIVTLHDQQLLLEVRAIGGSYRGEIAADGIAGAWSEGGAHLPLRFTHASSDVRRPQ